MGTFFALRRRQSVGWRVARMDDVLQCAAVVVHGPSVGVAAASLFAFACSSLSLPELRRWAKGELPGRGVFGLG
jgi:hypothetical protein